MICAWKEFLSILPIRIRNDVERSESRALQELRLRINAPPEYVFTQKNIRRGEPVIQEELEHVVHTASKYSPWCAATISQGFLTAPGGHRIGLCGEAVVKHGAMNGLRRIQSLCIRIAKDFPGIGREISKYNGSILILGAPGWGKTTLLRDVVRQLSQFETVSVVDERGELFPNGFDVGLQTDVLTGCSKREGMDILLRTMGPQCIAVDEITAEQDCLSLLYAAGCGVRLLATAHASSLEGFRSRMVYQKLVDHNVFQWAVVLHQDKSFCVERM